MKAPLRPSFYQYTGTLVRNAGKVLHVAISGPKLPRGYVVEFSPNPNGRPRSNFTKGLK